MSFSPWFQALASFSSAIFKRYPIDATGMLQYVANQLKDGKNLDLIVLRDLVSNCSGVEAGTDLTQEHIDALGGGDLLKQETGFGSQSKVNPCLFLYYSVPITIKLTQFQANKKAIARLKDSLLKSNLLEALCILMAQQKNFIVYREYNDYPLKLTAHMLDQCQETLVQFHQFLRWNMRSEEYMRRVPPIGELLSQEFLPMESAMFLVRGRYAERIHHSYDALKKAEREGGGWGGEGQHRQARTLQTGLRQCGGGAGEGAAVGSARVILAGYLPKAVRHLLAAGHKRYLRAGECLREGDREVQEGSGRVECSPTPARRFGTCLSVWDGNFKISKSNNCRSHAHDDWPRTKRRSNSMRGSWSTRCAARWSTSAG